MALTKGVDSYATVAEADKRIALNPFDTTWTVQNTTGKENAMKLATSRLDLYAEWYGWRTTEGQPLSWPREGVELRGGRGEYIDEEVTPVEIGWAAIELARQMVIKDRIKDETLRDLDIRATSSGARFGGGARRKPIPDEVAAIIERSGYGYVRHPDEVRAISVSR